VHHDRICCWSAARSDQATGNRDVDSAGYMHTYEVRRRNDRRGVDLISDVLPFGRLWYGERNAIENAVGYAKFYSRSHHAVIRVYEDAARKSTRTSKPVSPTKQTHLTPLLRGLCDLQKLQRRY
jgi:hypothetical protein